jgi:TonB family protein
MRIGSAVLLLLLFAAASAAQTQAQAQQRGTTLNDVLKVISAALQAGQYQKALDIDEQVIRHMLASLGPGDAETKAFATIVAHKALALSGLGKYEDALWYWRLAKNLSPDEAQNTASSFGALGIFLLNSPDARMEGVHRVGGEVKAPVVLKRVEPVYAEGARRSRTSGIVILECMIDATGAVRSGRVLKSLPAPTLSYTALEALRQWRFIPGSLDGQPVDVLFNLTINFMLKADETKGEAKNEPRQ